jgi:hypothetical protein
MLWSQYRRNHKIIVDEGSKKKSSLHRLGTQKHGLYLKEMA